MFESFSSAKAPEFPAGFDWINTDEPLSISKLRGNVVVLDFWTYCCINCMHTLPTLATLEKKYEGRPVVFIGVHSGKFTAEQEAQNVSNAVLRYEIRHPVLVDRRMHVWNLFSVNAWPTIVVIDPNGMVIAKQSGEPQADMLSDVIDVLIEKHAGKGTLAREPPVISHSRPEQRHVMSFPGKVSVSRYGRIAISDSNHNRILVCDLSGKIEKIVGSGKRGMVDGDLGSSAFFRPQGVAWNRDTLYVADTENHAIRKVDFENDRVSTVAGTGIQGPWASSGGKGTLTAISSPWDVACRDDKIFIAMAGSHQIWVHDEVTQDISPFAGTGQENIIDGPIASARLAQPSGIFIVGSKIYFADSEVSAVRRVDLETNDVKTLVGHGLFEFGYLDGHADDALFQHPLGLCATDTDVFVADTYNSAIRVINLKTSQVYTLIGKTQKNLVCMPENPECNVLPLYEPGDVEYYGGKLYIADTNNHLIRVFDLQKNSLDVLDVRV